MTTEEKLLKKILREQRKWKEGASKGHQAPNFKAISNALDNYYFVSKLKLYCAYLSYSKIKNAERDFFKISDIKYIKTVLATKEVNLIDYPAFKIYNTIRILFEQIDKEDAAIDQLYLELLQSIKNHHRFFDRAEKLDLYSFLSNVCIRKINLGINKYRERFFLINNEMLNIKYGQPKSKDVKLPLRLYKNMISQAILLKDAPLFNTLETKGLPKGHRKNYQSGLDWATQFTEIYRYKLEKKGGKVYYAYCSGLLYFIKKDYINAFGKLKDLSHVHFPFLNLDLKTLQLRVLYELDKIHPEILEKEDVQISKVLEAFRGMIRYEKNKGKRLTYQVTQYIHFEKLFRKLLIYQENYYGKLLNAKNKSFQEDKTVLLNILNENIHYRNWFLEKIEEIK